MARTASNPLRALWLLLPPPLRNRYFVALFLFLVFMVFIDRHDVMTQLKLRSVVNRMENDQEYYEGKIKEAEAIRLDRQFNQERFARETYYMQRENEDVFIIVPEETEE